MLAKERTAVAAQGIGWWRHPFKQIQIGSRQELQPGQMTSAFSRAEVILRPDAQSVRCPIAINIDLRQSINRHLTGCQPSLVCTRRWTT
jgi:hypothetical protein